MASITVILTITVLASFCKAAPNGNSNTVVKIPDECKSKPGLCHIKPDGYDELQEKINSLLPKHLIASVTDREGMIKPPKMNPESDWDNCPYITQTQSMYLYTQLNGTEHDIIVQTDRLFQTVETVKCAVGKYSPDDKQQCFKSLGLNSLNVETFCYQSYTYIDLYVYIPATEKIVSKAFPVETCCSCRLTDGMKRII